MTELAELYYKQGYDFHAQGNLDAAAASYQKTLALKPDHASALNNLGNILQAQGKFDQAVECYSNALSFKPNYPAAHYNLGNAMQAQGRLDDAAKSYHRAISFVPDYVDAFINLGGIFLSQGKPDAAIENYQKAISLRPDFAEAHSNLGNALMELGNPDAAVASYRQAILLKPYYGAHYNLGNALLALGKLDAAAESYRTALSLNPQHAGTYLNLGNVLREQGKPDAAIEHYNQAYSLNPDAMALSSLLYLHAYTRDIPPESELSLAAGWENIALDDSERVTARNRTFPVLSLAGRKLRLGIISAELGQHPVAEFLEPFLTHIDRTRFHVTLYPGIVRLESRAERFKTIADVYTSLAGLSDIEAVNQVLSDKIDILLDTSGHMRGCRLGIFARRCAPVQCHYIGYHGSTGLSEMDWFIADDGLLPAAYDRHFREKIWRLPRLRLAYQGDISLPDNQWKPDPDGTVWLGTFNNLAKVRNEALTLWAKILLAIPESKLLLKDSQPVVESVRKRIRDELNRCGIGNERIEFADSTPDWRSHMAMYHKLDIALDTVPLNSETTAFDALWMGVPIVALEGNWYGARMTGALLKALGKPEWVARNEDEFVARVAYLARDIEGREILRVNQRALMTNSPLCDASGLTRSLENAFEEMFKIWLARQTPGATIG